MAINIPKFSDAKVLVVGDVMLDRYWHGTTSRISPEAPVPVVHINEQENKPGGASNVALNTADLGAKTIILGTIGKDTAGAELSAALTQDNIEKCLQINEEIPTITKLRVISQHQQLLRLDFEEQTQNIDGMIMSAYKEQLLNCNLVILSDYGKGIATHANELIKLANKQNIPIIIDPKGTDFSIYKGATMLTPNMKEFEAVVGPCNDDNDVEKNGLQLLKKCKLKALLVTRGPKGMSLIQEKQPALHIPTHAREVFDVTGAGDTVIATLGAALGANCSLENAVKLANIAAGRVVRKLGAATVTEAELRHAVQIEQDSWQGIVSEDLLAKEIAELKKTGKKVVMTNGCFDIIHAGHVAYLEEAKALGDRLIIAVNSDESVARLKGENRPVNKLEQRMAVLAGLRAVDWVVSFTEDTPERIITNISPDILVKGGDYKVEEIAGAKHVLENGGEVKILTFVEDNSTTGIINKIREQ
ncbi:MAG: bifunctional D-glycero-beta-D-manno-heptose-7-phosphate kinase/D-glycero-beta-D-manno-heptose 1-phosphate adenylyltransferase HldE [Gammaproteobacteria bacterium]|nr:bifunctional D-glycero-beta-D-manno-heptose-7-phosphate kinase/D-glycero-beta-D-manno-heptose 1-phosphate adenylyltransferase HldE [Gammaproteobacteria bacterium]